MIRKKSLQKMKIQRNRIQTRRKIKIPKKEPEQSPETVKEEEKKPLFALTNEEYDEVFETISKVQRQHITTTYSVDKRFSSMQNRMDKYSQNWHSVSDKIDVAVGSFRGSDTEIGEAFSDMRTTIEGIKNLDNLMTSLHSKASVLKAIADQIYHGQSAHLDHLSQMTEKDSSWGWWLYFLPAQLLVAGLYIWYKKKKDGKQYKVL